LLFIHGYWKIGALRKSPTGFPKVPSPLYYYILICFVYIYRVSQKKLTPLLFIWISNVSGFFDSPCIYISFCGQINIYLSWRPLGVRIIKLVFVRLSNMPRLTKYQRVWVLWFPVQDIVYVKRTYFLRRMNKLVIQQLCFSFVLLATAKLYIKVNQIIFDTQFYANF
jgi:hypothetical protein